MLALFCFGVFAFVLCWWLDKPHRPKPQPKPRRYATLWPWRWQRPKTEVALSLTHQRANREYPLG
jgi:hypothetical protein